MDNMLAKAISLASKAFENKLDKGGKPYILHCLRVMFNVNQNDEELMSIAVLHDLLEDCPEYTSKDLIEAGFSDRVISAINILTHDTRITYDDYIKRIALNPDAKIVKLEDLKDNSNLTRIKGLRKKDLDRVEKYHRAFVYLNN